MDLQQQSLNISYDTYPLKEPLELLDRLLMEKFIEKANSTGRVNLGDDLLTNLTKLKLIKDGRPTLAAMLLFGNHGYNLHIGIRQWLHNYPEIEYKISEMGDYFRIELIQSLSKGIKESGGAPEKLPDLQKAIVLQMHSNPKVTYDQLAKTTQKSREAIRKNIRQLKDAGIIKRIGPDKGGQWQVTLT